MPRLGPGGFTDMKIRIVLLLLGVLLAGSAAAAGTLDRIRSSGVIRMGYVDGAAPFSYTGDDKQPQGYSVDLCNEVAEGIRAQLGLSTLEKRWVRLTIQDRLEAVRTGRIELECSTTTWTLSRQKDVDFSLITFIDGATLLVAPNKDLLRFSDYKGRRIAVIRGTTTANVLNEALRVRGISAEVVLVSDRGEGVNLIRTGKVDGFASDRIALIEYVRRQPQPGVLRLLDDDFSLEQYAFAMPRNDHDFRLAVNRVLARIYRTGEIKKFYDRWLGPLGEPSVLLYATYFVQSLAE